MENGRLYRLISRVADIRPGEETIALLLFGYFFFITAPFTMMKPLRTAVFLDKLGPGYLPLAYGSALLMGLVVAFHSKLQASLSRKRLVLSSLAFFIVTALIFFVVFPFSGKWMVLLFWIWLSIFILATVTQFWIVVNDIFNPREAKRLIGLIGSGGILGGVAGGFATKLIAKSNEAYELLLVAAALLAICAIFVHYIYRWRHDLAKDSQDSSGKTEPSSSQKQKLGFNICLNTVRKNTYLLLIASVIAVTAIVSTLIDWQFNKVMTLNEDIKSNMTAFFGLFYGLLYVIPFLFQLLATSNLIKRFKLRFTLLLYPAILLICSAGIAVWPVLWFGIIIKGSDKSLSFSINQSSRELLYIPVSPEKKFRAKIFIDMFLVRFAESFAALILFLLLLINTQNQIRLVSAVSALLISIWMILNLKVYQEYINTVKESIKPKWARADKDVADKVDVDYTKLIFDTIESKNRSSALYAMHMYDLLKQDKLTPEIKALISQQEDALKAASISDMFNAEGALWFPDEEDNEEQNTFETNIQEILSLDAYQELMKRHTDQVLADSRQVDIEKMEVAKAIGMMDPDSPLVEKLEALIQDDSPEVARYAIESAAKLKKPEHLKALIRKLSNPLIREDAITALIKYGSTAMGAVNAYLGDHHRDIELRRALVDALSRMGTQEATNVLMKDLDRKSSDLDSEIIDALDRIRSERPEIQIPPKIAKRETLSLAKKYCQTFLEIQDLTLKKKDSELRTELQKKLNVYFMDIFKLLGLYYPHDDVTKAYQNIERGTKDSMAYAVELLDNTLKKDLRDVLIPLIEDLTPGERAHRFQQLLKHFPNI